MIAARPDRVLRSGLRRNGVVRERAEWRCEYCRMHQSLQGGYELAAITPVGRVTIATLDLNRPRRILIRKAEELFGLFPPR